MRPDKVIEAALRELPEDFEITDDERADAVEFIRIIRTCKRSRLVASLHTLNVALADHPLAKEPVRRLSQIQVAIYHVLNPTEDSTPSS